MAAIRYTPEADNIIKIQFNSPDGFSLSYIDLMTHLKYTKDAHLYDVYTVIPLDDDGNPIRELTDREQLINSKIETVTSFNVSSYTIIRKENPITGGITDYEVLPSSYEHITINDYFLRRPILKAPKRPQPGEPPVDEETAEYNKKVSSIPDYKIINNMKSVLFNNTKEVTVGIDSMFPELDKAGNLKYNEEGLPIYTGIPDGTTFTLFFTVDTINGKTAELYYEFTYVALKEDEMEDEGDNSNSENDWNMGFDEDELPVEFGGFELSDERWSDYVFLNTVSVKQLRRLPNSTLTSYDGINRVYISPLCPEPFTFRLNVLRKPDANGNRQSVVYTFDYVPKKLNITEPDLTHVIKMNNPDVSYALVRTNPKLTGNVKVVVDSNSNIFLDTFKVSNTMSSRRYRRIKVGSNSYYGSTLMKYYKDIPTSEFYKIEDKCCNLFTTVQSYNDQYYDMYRCGVKTNDDKLYSENFAMLAPLCIKRIMPDFFLIFRVDKSLEDYNESMSDDEKLEYFLRFGKLVKSFDMRQHSQLGQYIRNIYDNSKNEAGDIYVSYDTDNYNKFIGISLDRGVVSSMYESIHLEKSLKSQVALNDFYTDGFKRNHIVSKDIINFEYMFDDTEPGLFSIKTYFGLYVKVNTETNDFSCIDSSVFKQKVNLETNGITNVEGESTSKTKLVEKTKYIFDTSIHSYKEGTDLRLSDKGTLIYGLTTPKEFIRLDTGLYDAECMKDYLLRPYKNIMTSKVDVHSINELHTSFITLQLNKPLEVGDHIRVIDTNKRVMYEVIMSDIENAVKTQGRFMDENNISEITTNYYNEYSTKYTIYRISMFINYRATEEEIAADESYSEEEIIKTHTSQLFAAFRKFYTIGGVSAYKQEGNKLSLIADSEQVLFQRICAPSGFIASLNTYLNESSDEDKTVMFFGQYYPEKVILNIDKLLPGGSQIPEWKTKQYAYLYPLNFDIVGNRMSYIMSFLPTSSVADNENFYSVQIINKDIFDATTLLYDQYIEGKKPEHAYVKYKKISLSVFSNAVDAKTGDKNTNLIERKVLELDFVEAFDDFTKSVVNIQRPVLQNGGQFSIYSSYPLNAGVCSILQYKDFDFDVLDKDSIITNSNVSMPVGYGGEYTERSFFNRRPNDSDDLTSEEEEFKFGVDIPDNDRNEDFNPYASMFAEGDSVLTIGEEKYVVKHYTVEEFKDHIIDRIRNIGFTSITMDSPIEDANATVTLTNIITEEQFAWIESILGYGDMADYDGYILRPFIPGTRAYDKDYEYFNYLISFNTAYTGRTDFVTSRDFDDYKEIKYKYDRWSEAALKKDEDGNYINPPDYFYIATDDAGNEYYVEYGLDELVYEGTSSCVAPVLEGVKNGIADDKTYCYFPIDDLLNRTLSPVYTCVKIKPVTNSDGEKESYEITPLSAVTHPAKALGNNKVLDLNNAAFTSYKVTELFSEDNIDSVRNLDKILSFGANGRILERDFACFINEWNLEKCEKAENPEEELGINGGNSGGLIMEELNETPLPIRADSEENIQDYINKFRSFEDKLKGLSFAKSDPNNYKNRSDYLKILYDNNHTKFDVPLVSPCACKWKSNGTDARVENMRIMYDYNKLVGTDSYYVVGKGSYDSYLGVLYLKERNTTSCGSYPNYSFNKYINKSLDDVMFSKENTSVLGYYAKDYILDGVGCLDDILYDSKSKKTKFSTAYLSGQNTLEFISGGIKFRIRSTNDNVIDFSKYVGYSAVFVNLPFNNITANTQTELIIDELRNEIMLVWYSYCNTLRYGVKLERMENAIEVFNELFPIKLNYTKSLSDVVCSQIVDIRNSSIHNAALIEDTMKLGEEDTINPPAEFIKDGKIYHKGARLCKERGFIYLSSMGVNTNDFTKSNNICITSKIYDKEPITNSISTTFPYYARTGYLTPINPFIWHNNVDAKYNYHEELSNGAIDKYAYDLSDTKDCILYTDDIASAPTNKRSVGQLNEMLGNYSVYVKTENGTKNYSTVKNLLSIEIVDPIEYNRDFLFTRQRDKKLSEDGKPTKTYKVHSTYATPVMKDVFNFNYNSLEIKNNTKAFKKANVLSTDDIENGTGGGSSFIVDTGGTEENTGSQTAGDSLEEVFGRSFDGGNVSIQSVNPINQIWINKYTEDSNYCSQNVEYTSTYAIPAVLKKNEKAIRERLYDIGYKYIKAESDGQKETNYAVVTSPKDMTFRILTQNNAKNYVMSEESAGIQYTDCGEDEKKFFKCATPADRISVDHTMLLSVDVVDNVSVLDDSWESTLFRKYQIDRTNGITENYENVKGYRTGLEVKTFFNSKGIVLKSKNQSTEVEITNWKNTYINDEEGYIRLDINDSLVYSILQTGSFIESWQPLYLTTNEHKINYIKNYVLNFININNKTKFILRKDKSMLKSLRFNGIYDDEFEEVKNFKNELKHENGKYYMYVYPSEKHMYYAKMIITL